MIVIIVIIIIIAVVVVVFVVVIVVSGPNVLQTASCTFLKSDPFLGPEVPEGYF